MYQLLGLKLHSTPFTDTFSIDFPVKYNENTMEKKWKQMSRSYSEGIDSICFPSEPQLGQMVAEIKRLLQHWIVSDRLVPETVRAPCL